MLDTLLVIAIVCVAAFFTGRRIYHNIKGGSNKGSSCGTCSGCSCSSGNQPQGGCGELRPKKRE